MQIPRLSSVPRSSLAREPLMASSSSDDNRDPPLLYWTSDGLSSPIQPSFSNRYPVRYTSDSLPTASASNTNSRSPTENDLGRQDARRPPLGADWDGSLGPGDAITYLYKERLGIDHTHENANPTDHSEADELFYGEGSAGVVLEESVEMEINDLLEELMDYHSRRDTMTSMPLLPLPGDVPHGGGSFVSQSRVNPSPPPLLAADVLYSGDSDTPSLTSSSPRSSKGSHLSSASPSLKSKRSFTPVTPSTDGWRSPATLGVVPEREATSSDHLEHLEVPGRPGVYSLDPRRLPGDIASDSDLSVSTEGRRTHHNELPPLADTIPQDATIHRRAQNSLSSERTITNNHSRHTESPTDPPASLHSSDDGRSKAARAKHIYPGFEIAYISTSGAFSPLFTRPRPRIKVPPGSGSGSFTSERSPSSSPSVSSRSTEHPSSSSNNPYTPNQKRGVFRSLFPHNGGATSERKEERKRAKSRDQIQTQSLAARSMDSVFGSTSTSSKSSKERDKHEKNAERAAKRAQLAVQLRAKQLQQAAEKDPRDPSRTTGAQKGSAAWEEGGAMYSLNGIL